MGKTTDYWMIKHIDSETKRQVKSYAILNGLTVAQALKELVGVALTKPPK